VGINTMTADKSAAEGLSFAIALEALWKGAPPELGVSP